MKRNLRLERGRASERLGTYRERTRSVPMNFYECARTDGQDFENNDMVSVKAAREMLNAATKS